MKFTKHIIPVFSIAVLSAVVAGCSPSGNSASFKSESGIDQVNICEVKNWQHDVTSTKCKPGQKVVYLPSSWGNEQLPIMFAAVNCDLRYAIAMNNGGVTCVFNPITPKPEPKQAPASAPEASTSASK